MKSKITDSVEQMIQYKKDGLTNIQIAAKFDCSKTTINNYFAKIGYNYQTQTATISTQEELDQLKKLQRKKTHSSCRWWRTCKNLPECLQRNQRK